MSYHGEDRRKNADYTAYFNALIGLRPVPLKPGEYVFSDSQEEMIVAGVGRGLFVTLFDPLLKCGAAAYIVFPEELLNSFPYIEEADQRLKDKIFSVLDQALKDVRQPAKGENDLFVRLCGATEMPDDPKDIGLKARIFIKEYFIRNGVYINNEDCGGAALRRVHFVPHNGRVVRTLLRRKSDFEAIESIEESYFRALIEK